MEASDAGGLLRFLLGQVQTLRTAVYTVKSLALPRFSLRSKKAWEGVLQGNMAGWAVQTQREDPSSAKGIVLEVQKACWQLHKDKELDGSQLKQSLA